MRTGFGVSLLFGFASVALLAVGLVACKAGSRGVTVMVNNASGGEITNLQVKFTGGSKSSPKLKPAESFETKVNPSGESHLVVEFVDSSGKQHSVNVDVYFEHNYSGTIHVTIEPDGNVTWKDETKV